MARNLFLNVTSQRFATSFTDARPYVPVFTQNNQTAVRIFLVRETGKPSAPFEYDAMSGTNGYTAAVSLSTLTGTAVTLSSGATWTAISHGWSGTLDTAKTEIDTYLAEHGVAARKVTFQAEITATGTKVAEFHSDVVLQRNGDTGVVPTPNNIVSTLGDLTDPNADRILFWDDSADAYKFLTPGTGLSISATTMNATVTGLTGGTSGHVVTASGATTIADSGTALSNLQTKTGTLALGGFSSVTGVLAASQVPPQGLIYVGSGDKPSGSSANYGLNVLTSSDNGNTWSPYAIGVYAPPTNEDFRDPALLIAADAWWIVHTAGTFGNVSYFSLVKSVDQGKTWNWVKNVTTPGSNTWSPRWLVDADGSVHVFVTCHNGNTSTGVLYELHPTSSTNLAGTWSNAVSTGITGFYDNWEFKTGAVYNFVICAAGQHLQLWQSTSLTSGAAFKADLLFNGSAVTGAENQSIYPIDNGWGILYYDSGPKWATSRDLINWTAPKAATALTVNSNFAGAVAKLTPPNDAASGQISPARIESIIYTVGTPDDIQLGGDRTMNVRIGNRPTQNGLTATAGQLRLSTDNGWTDGGIRFNGSGGAALAEYHGLNKLGLRLPSSGLEIVSSDAGTVLGTVSDAGAVALKSLSLTSAPLPVASGGTGATSVAAALASLFAGIPTADPHVVGHLWSNSGVVTISAG